MDPPKNYLDTFMTVIEEKMTSLYQTIFGYPYVPINSFSKKQKDKILAYLRVKFISLADELEKPKKKSFIKYSTDFDKSEEAKTYSNQELFMHARSNLQNAKNACENTKDSLKFIKAHFLQEQAYEFWKAVRTSGAWGLIFGAFMASYLDRSGRAAKKLAIFVTMGHLFGVYGYWRYYDIYFDSVYKVFEEEAVAFRKEEAEQLRKWQKQHTL